MENGLTFPKGGRVPYLTADRYHLDLTGEGYDALLIRFPRSVWGAGCFLVIDVYSERNHVHPNGHVGWWRFELEGGKPVAIRLARTDDGICANSVDGPEMKDSWVNREMLSGLDEPVLLVHLVLRQRASGAIVADEVVPAFQTREALQARNRRQQAFLTDGLSVRKAAMPWYCWPSDRRVHVVSTWFSRRDAVGNFSLALLKLFRQHEVPCRLYASTIEPRLRGALTPLPELFGAVEEGDVVLYHFSTADPYLGLIAELPCRKIAYFHNVTPPRYVQAYDAEQAMHCRDAYGQTYLLARFDLLLANSRYSASQLRIAVPAALRVALQMNSDRATPDGEETERGGRERRLVLDAAAEAVARALETGDEEVGSGEGLPPVRTCPPLITPAAWAQVEKEDVELAGGDTRLLFVGRLAPHKRAEDLVAMFDRYHRLDPASSLLIVGRTSLPVYRRYLDHLRTRRYPQLRDKVHILGEVTDGQLKTLYESSSAFVTMSEHEGFCLPLVEAMHFQIPVFAYAQPAVRETLARSGRVFYRKDPDSLASAIFQAVHDEQVRQQILERQNRRFEEIARQADGSKVWAALEEILALDESAS